jgi:hypothetical protein
MADGWGHKVIILYIFFTNNANPTGLPAMSIMPNRTIGIGTILPLATLDVFPSVASYPTATFRGSAYDSEFNDGGADERTYISGGKLGSKVFINPFNKGDVIVNGTEPRGKFTVYTETNNYGFIHSDNFIKIGTYVGGGAGWLGTKSEHP